MKASITSTDVVVDLGPSGPKARVWEGVSENGVSFTAYIPVIQVARRSDCTEFERELSEHKPADKDTLLAINLRMVL